MIFKRRNLRKTVFLFYWFCFLVFTNVFAQDAAEEAAEEALDRGINYYEKGNFDAAMAEFNKAIESNHDSWVTYFGAYYYRGLVYLNKGDYNQAISEFTKSIELNPDFNYAYRDRGLTHNMAGNYDQAISDFNKAIQLRPDAVAYYGLGSAYSIKRDYGQAHSEFNKAIKLDPNYGDAYYKRAWTCYFLGKYNEAWEDVQKAESLGITINPKFLAALKDKLSGREK